MDISFELDDALVDVTVEADETLLSVLRERLAVTSVKDGCAPQGQCGCCTVLVDDEPRVACVTPAARVNGRVVRTVVTVPGARDLAERLCATGGSQCGFCTPGIIVRVAAKAPKNEAALDRVLAAHLCRCTGWQTIREAVLGAVTVDPARDLDAASRRATLELGAPQNVGPAVALGGGQFADDTAPRDALVAVPAGDGFVVGESLAAARRGTAKVQGRRTTVAAVPPLAVPEARAGEVVLATSWVETAYLEPDASWCEPGDEPAPVRGNGGAFGGKRDAIAGRVARELADEHGRTVRVVYAREDVARTRPKRPPVAARAWRAGDEVRIEGDYVGAPGWFDDLPVVVGGAPPVRARWTAVTVPGPPTSAHLRAAGSAETAMLTAAAMGLAGSVDVHVGDASANASVDVVNGRVKRVAARVDAGAPLDEVVLRSYVIGAAHAAVSWVTSEKLAVDPDTGEVLDLTIRSFGVLRPKDSPRVDVTVAPSERDPVAVSPAVFCAVAAAAWTALGCPAVLPHR